MTEFTVEEGRRVRELEYGDVEEEYVTMEATVEQLFDADSDSIRQSGLLRDPTGIMKFVSWESSDVPKVEEGETYLFRDVTLQEQEEYDNQISFRSKTTVDHQYSGYREQYFEENVYPDDKNAQIDFEKYPLDIEVVCGNSDMVVKVVEDGLGDAEVPWDETFVRSVCEDAIGREVMTDTQVAKYTYDSATVRRKYVLPHECYKQGIEFLEAYEDFVSQEFVERVGSGMHSNRRLARIGECDECGARFPIESVIGYDPVEESDGLYVNWWYGGHGTETNEDFERVSCVECGAEPEWYPEHEYGRGVVHPPSMPKEVMFEFEVGLESVESMDDVLNQISDVVGCEFDARYSKGTVVRMKTKELNEMVDGNFFDIEKSGDVGRRGLTRQYIQWDEEGIFTVDGVEEVNEMLDVVGERLCRVKDISTRRGSRSKMNGFYYGVE